MGSTILIKVIIIWLACLAFSYPKATPIQWHEKEWLTYKYQKGREAFGVQKRLVA